MEKQQLYSMLQNSSSEKAGIPWNSSGFCHFVVYSLSMLMHVTHITSEENLGLGNHQNFIDQETAGSETCVFTRASVFMLAWLDLLTPLQDFIR